MASELKPMEKANDGHCERSLHDIISMLGLFACFIFFIIMRWIDKVIENRFLFRTALFLQFLLSKVLDNLGTKYITPILSYIYISVCKSILSIRNIDFSLATRNSFLTLTIEAICKSILSIRNIDFSLVTRNSFLTLTIEAVCKSILSIRNIDFSLVTRNSFLTLTIETVCKSMLSIRNIDFSLIYITFISYIFIVVCKFILIVICKSILFIRNIDLSLVTGNRLQYTLKKGATTPTTTTFPLLYLLLNFSVMISDKFNLKQLRSLSYFLLSHLDTQYNKSPVREDALKKTESKPQVDTKDVIINRDELEFVMERIGEPTTKEGEQTDNFCMGYGEFSALFQESEPSLDEVKEAFSVFDQNRDGLVDAGDVQRELINLGLREGTNLEACQRMIAQYDRNKDGNVDLIDFSRLLEMSLLGNGD